MYRRIASSVIALLTGCVLLIEAPLRAPTLRPFGDNQAWVLTENFIYVVGETRHWIVVPKGFVTDFASIPKPLWWWISPNDHYSRAALVHDYLYWAQGCTKSQSDNLMLIAMKESNVPASKQFAVYRGVRIGGTSAWNTNRAERSAGMLRIIPDDRLVLPPNVTWPAYQKSLMALGLKDPPLSDNPSYCSLGDDVKIPDAEG